MRSLDGNCGETPADVWQLVLLLQGGTRLAYCECCEGVSENLVVCTLCGADGMLSELDAQELQRDLLKDAQQALARRQLPEIERVTAVTLALPLRAN